MWPSKILKSPIILVFLALVPPLVRCQYYALPPLPPLCFQQISLANHACSKLPFQPIPDRFPPPRPRPPRPHPPPGLPPPIPRPPVIPPCGPPGTICPPSSPEFRPPFPRPPETRPPFPRPPEIRPPFPGPPVIPPCGPPGTICPPPIPRPPILAPQIPIVPLLPSPYTGPSVIPPSPPISEPLPAPPPPARWEVESSQGHHRHHETPDQEDCCRWLKVIDVECICQILIRLPPFLSKPLHDYTVYVDESCGITFECPGRLAFP